MAEEARTEGEKPERRPHAGLPAAVVLRPHRDRPRASRFGLLFEEQALKAQWLAEAFIQLIKAVTGPVIFVTVVIGIASLGDMARAGGLALRALGYFLTMTVIALALGLLAGNIVKPGSGFEGEVSASAKADAKASIGEAGGDQGLVSFITDDLLPTSFVSPFVENEILRVLVLAMFTAAAVSSAPEGAAREGRRRLRGRQPGHLPHHPPDHVGRADRRVRRHGVHRREVRRHLADQSSAC